MHIKTITCHDVYNLGASLQAYALVTYLKQLGHEAEIIDYKPEYLSRHYRLWGGVSKKYDIPIIRTAYCIAKFPGRLKNRCGHRKKEFDSFKREYLPCTEKQYHSYEELKEDPPYADIYFAGSDQIWNTVFPNGRDPSFYLQFTPTGAVRASYAASFATESVMPEYRSRVQRWVDELDYISVRESSGLAILESLGIDRGVQVMDPVFLLSREYWKKICQPMEVDEPYLLVYDFDRNPQIEAFVKAISRQKHLLIYSLLPCSYCDRSFADAGPRTFLSLVNNAETVVSNSFHATAFSIIFEKNFWVFPRNENINTRMRDLTRMFSLDNRFVVDGQSDISKEIDYDIVRSAMNNNTSDSKQYILQAITRSQQIKDES